MKSNILIEELRDMCRTLKPFNITHVTKKVNERKFELLMEALKDQFHVMAFANCPEDDIKLMVEGINLTITKYKLFQDET